MSKTNRTQLFDDWASDYHPEMKSDDDVFPFAGYAQILDEVVRLANIKRDMRILDLGTGTGNLAQRFLTHDCEVWGTDFSSEMLAQTRLKCPQMHLVKMNLLDEWPEEIFQPFDRVVSAYVFHEFDLATKINMLQRIINNHLAENGYIILADIAFPTEELRAAAAQRWADEWDEDEYYWAADEAIAAAIQAGWRMEYRQLSKCGGVFIIQTTY